MGPYPKWCRWLTNILTMTTGVRLITWFSLATVARVGLKVGVGAGAKKCGRAIIIPLIITSNTLSMPRTLVIMHTQVSMQMYPSI